jgi:diguanylate cyclase (GGDEF)-like protein
MEYNILLVDDDPGLIRVMARMLAGLGQFRFATTGEGALQLVRDWEPDLLILDAELPGMSGFQICEKIKSDPTLRDIPIIFVTSHNDHDFEVKALEIGASDFIAKPVNDALMLARVKTQLRLKRLTDDLRRSATKDLVTRLPNRLSFEETLSKEWARNLRSGNEISLLMVELDHLEPYTERYGHGMVDQTMRKVAQALGRTIDHPANYLARFDRSTFAFILPETGREGAEQRAHAAIDAIENLGIDHQTSPTSGHVTCSVGLAMYDKASRCWVDPLNAGGLAEIPECDSADLRHCAQSALEQARRSGGGQSWWLDIGRNRSSKHAQEISPHSRPMPLRAAA